MRASALCSVEQHTAANIAEAIKNVLAQWGLDSPKLAGATGDNAANIQKAMVDILSWKCLGCLAAHILETKQEALEKPKQKLIQEVDTRWNSTYDMVVNM